MRVTCTRLSGVCSLKHRSLITTYKVGGKPASFKGKGGKAAKK